MEVSGFKALYLRRTFPDLERSVIRRSQTKYPKGLGKYNEVKHLWTFVNSSTLEFGSLDREMDVLKYQSAEYDLIIFDELTHFTEYQYTYMRSRNRTTLAGVKPRMRSGTNPGGIGHGWVKTMFIDPAPPETVWVTEEGTTRCFIPAKVTDNLILMQRDPLYVKRLQSLPENERKALLEGDWDIFAGQYFREFRRDKHVVTPFAIPPEWVRFCSIDWGYNDPCAVYWHAVAPDRHIYTYRELYINQTKASDVAKKMLELSRGEGIEYTKMSQDAWQKRGNDHEKGECIAETFIDEGIYVEKADNDRLNGWQRMHEYLADAPDGKPYWQIFDTCTNLVRTLPELVHDEHRVEDVSSKCEDHAAESCRYGLMSRPDPKGLGDIVGTAIKVQRQPNMFDSQGRHYSEIEDSRDEESAWLGDWGK